MGFRCLGRGVRACRFHRLLLHGLSASAYLGARSPVAAQPAPWRLSANPALTIDETGGPQGEFLRISGLARLASGVIAVANGATAEIRLFAETGRYLRTLGRRGGGPGEFREISWMGVSGDTIFVADRTGARITRYLEDGSLVGTVPITAADSVGGFSVVGRLTDGRWLVQTVLNPRMDGPERLYRDTMTVGLLATDGTRVRWIARLPALSVFVYNPRGTPSGAATGIAPLGPSGFIAGAGSHFAAADGATPAITLYNDHGGIERTFALPYVVGQFEDAEVAAARRLRLEEATSEFGRSLFAAVYSKTARPATKPVLGGLRRGTDGSFWVWPFSLAADAATTYHVVAVNGDLVATVAGPARFRLREAGLDYLLGVSTDAEGVERVVLYRLERWKR